MCCVLLQHWRNYSPNGPKLQIHFMNLVVDIPCTSWVWINKKIAALNLTMAFILVHLVWPLRNVPDYLLTFHQHFLWIPPWYLAVAGMSNIALCQRFVSSIGNININLSIFNCGEYPHLVTIDPQHASINTAISGGFSSVERRASSRQEAHEP